METIDTIFVGGPFSRAYRVTFTDGQVFILDEVLRGKDQGEPPHIVANVVKVLNGSEEFAAGPGGPAIFFYLREIAEVRDAQTDDVLFVAQ
jgi:hypothetical protein